MRRFSSASFVAVAALLLFTTFWSACGGGGSNATFVITSFIFSPQIISLEPGQVVTVAATPYNASGTVVSATVTYTSSDQTNAAISQGGSLCAGTWDATFTVCTPTNQAGNFTITATANGATGTATAYIHYHIDAVYMHAPTTACTSMGKTAGVTASACTSPLNITGGTCTTVCADNSKQCDITASVGGFNFGVIDSEVASISTTGTTNPTSGMLTAGIPGTTKVYAVATSGSSATSSTAVPYTTCLVDSVLLTANSSATSVSVATAATATLQTTVLDSSGTTITPTLTYDDQQSVVGTTAAASATGTATFTGKAPGYGAVVASCTPPNCNKNANAVFSNVVTTTDTATSGGTVTANDTSVYVSGAGAVQMYPFDTTTFALGTVISLPYAPNSMLISRDGTHIFMGGDKAGMVVTTASNSVQTLSFPGKVLAVAPNNAYVIFANTDTTTTPPTGAVYIMSGSSLTIANTGGFTTPGVTAASFTPDGNTVYFVAGTAIYRYRVVGDNGSTPAPLTLTPGGNPLTTAAADLKTSANGTVLFSSTTPNIVADETCNALVSNQYISAFEPLGANAFTTPTMMAAIPNGSGMLAVDGTSLDTVSITKPNPLTSPFAGCPTTGFATTPSTISLSALGTGFTVNQLVMSNSGHYAAVLTGCTGGGCTPQVGIVDLTKGTLTAVSLVDKGTAALTQVYSGDFMIDDSGIWVGADDSYVHFVDVTKLADTEQVQVQIQGPSSGTTINYVNPTFVTVQHK